MARKGPRNKHKLCQNRNNYFHVDRISELPDDALINILSLMSSTREAGRTCVLSKRWIHLWKQVTCVNFDDTDDNALSKPREFPDRLMQSHQGSTLDGFRIRHCDITPNIDNWIEFAMQKKVQKLEVHLKYPDSEYWYDRKLYIFPETPFTSLTHLSLEYVNITGELVQSFLSNCQLLEHLSISQSEDLKKLKVFGPSLRLKFLQISDCPELDKLKISAPNLVSLVYHRVGCVGRKIVLKDAPSLVKVSLAEVISEYIARDFQSISGCFSHLETLSLCMNISGRGINIMLPEFPELTSLKDLSLSTSAADNGQSLMNLTSLIERSPFLHRLALQLKWEYLRPARTRDVHKITKCPHKWLKVVKFSGFNGFGSILDNELAMYIIENAVVLEKLIVDLNNATTRRSRARKHVSQLEKQLRLGAELIII